MSMGSDTTWVGKKPLRRIGGMSDALSIAADLGFSVSLPSQVTDPSISVCLYVLLSFMFPRWIFHLKNSLWNHLKNLIGSCGL